MSKHHIVGNHMLRLILRICFKLVNNIIMKVQQFTTLNVLFFKRQTEAGFQQFRIYLLGEKQCIAGF